MSRPSLFRRLSRWLWGGMIVLGLFVAGLLAVNLHDGLAYRRALHQAENLSDSELQKLAEFCRPYAAEAKHRSATDDEIPPELRWLKPVSFSSYPGTTDITFFQRTYPYHLKDGTLFFDVDVVVALRVSGNSQNQTITSISSAMGAQRSRILWSSNPELTRRLHPMDRVLTVTENDMHATREWVVRPTELLIVDRPYNSGSSDAVVKEVVLDASQLARIKTSMASFGPAVRSHVFDVGAMDGVQLSICFAGDGHEIGGHEDDDVLLRNAWTENVRPLVDVINEFAGKDAEITFPKAIERMNAMMAQNSPGEYPVTVTPLSTYNKRYYWRPLPWWCLWPRFVN